MIKYSSILITGGTGSFGNAMVTKLLKRQNKIKRLVIFSRDELKQSQMMERFPQKKYPMLRFFIGDVRDKERLKSAFSGIDLVIHAAAAKGAAEPRGDRLGAGQAADAAPVQGQGLQSGVDGLRDRQGTDAP